MRFPQDGLDAVALIRHAIDSGMRYIDTSRGYGESEFILGKALKDGYREKVILSTKCSPWIKKVTDADDGSADSVRRRIEESLIRLDVDYLDFYQVWNVNNADAWKTATQKGGMVEGILKAKEDGLIKHTGFTTHEKPELVIKYLDEADWCEILLVSYNLLNKSYAPVLEAAHHKGIGTIVMNPVGGGKLAAQSEKLQPLIEKVGAESLADLAVRFVLSNTNVDTILCGMSKLSDVDNTIASAQRPRFGAEQLQSIESFFTGLSRENVEFCTGCRYCVPCPAGIEIPGIMSGIYEAKFLGLFEGGKGTYNWNTRDVKVDACTDCGACEKKCTQSLPIRKELQWAKEAFA
jgi:predicted aldo/keto reductase-like oxidoreductase